MSGYQVRHLVLYNLIIARVDLLIRIVVVIVLYAVLHQSVCM